ncbi:MAG: tRNA epoxyqueuosine(34) reductase QueG [Vicinamibacterales bacterium]
MTTPELSQLSSAIKQHALTLGFDACGIAPATGLPELAQLKTWLANGYAGEMTFLEKSADLRDDARGVLPSAQSVIVTATVYNTDRPYSTQCTDPERAHVSRYAWGDDYHVVLMRRLDALVAWMHEQHPAPFEAAPYVDTGPLQERVFARHAGIGWIGKNCCVISPTLGSFVFLAEIACSLPLTPDEPARDRCGQCTLCIDACPTEALVAPHVLDARRCISYLTIEHRGPIAPALQAGMETRVYGCDVCQEVCPYNVSAPVSRDAAWQPRAVWDQRSVGDLLRLDAAELKAGLVGSAMMRARKAGVQRNIRIAAENAGVPIPTYPPKTD